MISIKRGSDGQPVAASGIRSRASSMYTPGQAEPFRISRSKFNDFLSCQRCFYLDRVKGLTAPSTPGWSLNDTTDELLKREFDAYRAEQAPHPAFQKFGLGDVVPYQHPDLDRWRDSLRHGLAHQAEGSNIVLHGGVDDVWYHRAEQQLIIVDYKSQASRYPVRARRYLEYGYHQSYKVQLDVYAYLLVKMGFPVWHTGYFYVWNANRDAPAFNGNMAFQDTLVPYRWDADWIEERLRGMAEVLNSQEIPASNPACENCAYARARSAVT